METDLVLPGHQGGAPLEAEGLFRALGAGTLRILEPVAGDVRNGRWKAVNYCVKGRWGPTASPLCKPEG